MAKTDGQSKKRRKKAKPRRTLAEALALTLRVQAQMKAKRGKYYRRWLAGVRAAKARLE